MKLTQAEFLDKFQSNQIASATIVVNQQLLPLTDINGTYLKTDKDGKATREEVPFVVRNAWLTQEMLNTLTRSGKIQPDGAEHRGDESGLGHRAVCDSGSAVLVFLHPADQGRGQRRVELRQKQGADARQGPQQNHVQRRGRRGRGD